MAKTGWERERRTHFDEIADEYDKIRWDYPDELFYDAIDYSNKNIKQKDKKAVEIGAGTGKATAPFLENGYDVTAVEMGTNMTAFLVEKYKRFSNFRVITSTFEDAALNENSYDLVYAASAFHWVDAEVGCPKVHKLLNNGGAFILFRCNWNSHDNEELAKDLKVVYEKYYYTYYKTDERDDKPTKHTLETLQKPEAIFKGFRFERMENYGFKDVTMKIYDKMHTYDTDSYIRLLDTFSDHRALPRDNRGALYAGVNETIEIHGGLIQTHNTYQLYMGRKGESPCL